MPESAQTSPAFLVEGQLEPLGRWLRAAGYDTEITADARANYYTLQQAREQGRLLLTRNPELSQLRRASDTVIVLRSAQLDDCARQLADSLSFNWQYNPFSRCTACNHPFSSDKSHEYCPGCQQVYWKPEQRQRLQGRLSRWQSQRQE